MLRSAYDFLRMTLITAVFFSGSAAFAETVLHNGFDVDADGPVSYCVSCHDGVIAKNVAFCQGNCGPEHAHSVLKRYPPFGKERFFAPASLVTAKGIKLPEGKTACISCHDLRSRHKKYLVMDNRGSRLCLSCHIK